MLALAGRVEGTAHPRDRKAENDTALVVGVVVEALRAGTELAGQALLDTAWQEERRIDGGIQDKQTVSSKRQ